MNYLFSTPDWVRYCESTPATLEAMSPRMLAELKNGLARFRQKSPLVSIVIPVWNEEKNMLRTLMSFSKMYLPCSTELIIVNNNSTDRTQQILEKTGVAFIQEKKQGIAHARLAGLRAAKGKYHLCGDGDSLYPPHWIITMIEPLVKDEDVTCVYSNYSFIPYGKVKRYSLGIYELMAEGVAEFRKIKRGFLNVRGANFGFRTTEGIDVKGFEMPVTRVFNNTEGAFVIFGEDGRMGRKLGELGKIVHVRSNRARIWTSSRRLVMDGTLLQAFLKRAKMESGRLLEYLFGSKKIQFTTDNLTPHIE